MRSPTNIAADSAVLGSFVPTYRRQLLLAPHGPLGAPFFERVQGAILFIDIAGFTRLAERLAADGARGAERLAEVVNASFGPMTERVLANGGDVISYAGDALLAMWPVSEDGQLPPAVAAAAQAALEVQGILRDFRPMTGVVLTVRASIGAGSLSLLELGGVDGRWEFLAAGEAVAQIAGTDRAARGGDVVVSASAWRALSGHATGTPVADGAVRLHAVQRSQIAAPSAYDKMPIVTQTDSLLARVPRIVAERVAAAQADWLAEFREVSAMFVGLASADVTAAARLDALQDAVEMVQRVLARYEGSVYQTVADDKGITIIGVFGLPPHAHEDDPWRAMVAALELQEALKAQGQRAGVGIATGRVFCGIYGTRDRQQYTIVGPSVNLAARLMQAADDRALCDGTTATASRGRRALQLLPLAPLHVKGRDEPVSAFELVSAPPAAGRSGPVPPPTMIGRAAEQAALAQALRALGVGTGGIILLEGEPGMGKSRLVADAAAMAGQLRVRVLLGHGDESAASTPHHVWGEIFRELLAIHQGTPAIEALRERLRSVLEAQGLADLGALIEPIAPLGLPETAVIHAMRDEVRAANTRRLAVALLEHLVGGEAVLLAIEDVHWLDSASWELLAATVEALPALLLVMTARSVDPERPVVRALLEREGTQRLKLGAMSVAEVSEVVGRLLGANRVADDVALLVHERAGGNPLFAEQLSLALREEGIVSVDGGACVVAAEQADPLRALDDALRHHGLPANLQGIITSRIDRLSPEQQLTLKVASVIGLRFPPAALLAVYPAPATIDDVDAVLEELRKLELLRDTATGDGLTEFAHAVLRDTIYDSVPFAQRRQLHRAVAEWYERSMSLEERPQLYAVLALHWRRAEEVAPAVRYLTLAGTHALRSFASGEAVAHLTDALALDGARPSVDRAPARSRGGWELQLGEAYVNWSRYPDGRTHLERGLRQLGFRTPTSVTGASVAILGELARQMAHRRWPARYVARAGVRRDELLLAARAYESLVEAYFLTAATAPCLFAALRTLNLAESAGPSPELARAYAAVGAIAGFVPAHGMARAYCDRALTTVQTLDDAPARAYVSMAVAVYHAGLGQWREARMLLQDTLEISKRLGDHRRWEDGANNMAAIAFLEGAFEESLTLGEAFYSSATRRRDAIVQAEGLRRRAYCRLALGDVASLDDDLDELSRIRVGQEAKAGAHQYADVHVLRALTALRRDDLEAARVSADAALARVAKSQPASFDLLAEYSGLAESYVTIWERMRCAGISPRAELVSGARAACKRLAAFARIFPVGLPALHLWQGEMRDLTGDRRRARGMWESAVASAARLGMRRYEALASDRLRVASG
ncbi:MAG TPA: AAA family ATPase [Gemmatimonadaceae bacterium]|nr:AAA family ATPase [Gemmatimonadaceae bacterium]